MSFRAVPEPRNPPPRADSKPQPTTSGKSRNGGRGGRTQTGMGASMVGRLPQRRRQNRSETRVYDSRLRCRVDSQASVEARFGEAPAAQPGETYADGNDQVQRFHRSLLRPKRTAYTEAVHAEPVSLYTQLSPQTSIWSQAPLRCFHPEPPIVGAEQNGGRFRLGGPQSPRKPDVEGVRIGEEMGTLRGGEPGHWRGITGKDTGSRETCAYGKPDSAPVGLYSKNRFERWFKPVFFPVCASGRFSVCDGKTSISQTGLCGFNKPHIGVLSAVQRPKAANAPFPFRKPWHLHWVVTGRGQPFTMVWCSPRAPEHPTATPTCSHAT